MLRISACNLSIVVCKDIRAVDHESETIDDLNNMDWKKSVSINELEGNARGKGFDDAV